MDIKKNLFSACILLILCSISQTVAQCCEKEVIDFANLQLNQNLLKGSRWAIEQQQKKVKIVVYHAIEVVDISKVDVDTMSVRLEIHMRQRWESLDMKLPDGLFEDDLDTPDTFIRAPPAILDSLWSPDSLIPMARDTKIASLATSQSVVNIFRNKTIIYKARMYTILGCAFNFRWYPLDKQICDLTIESYTWPTEMTHYVWEDQINPVTLSDLKLLQYELYMPMFYTNGTASRWGTSVTYPYVLLRFQFERQLGNALIQVFVPTILVVILSWFSFWLGMDAIPGRISLSITCMLTLVTMHSNMKGAIPPVNYIKMMDIWMVACMAFVFASLCEFIIVKYLHWRKQQELKNKADRDAAMEKYKASHPDDKKQKNFNPYLDFYRNMDKGLLGSDVPYPIAMMQMQQRNRKNPNWANPGMMGPDFYNQFPFPPPGGNSEEDWPFVKKKKPIWVHIDRVSRVVFPLAFAVFNAAYWPLLLIGAANQ